MSADGLARARRGSYGRYGRYVTMTCPRHGQYVDIGPGCPCCRGDDHTLGQYVGAEEATKILEDAASQ